MPRRRSPVLPAPVLVRSARRRRRATDRRPRAAAAALAALAAAAGAVLLRRRGAAAGADQPAPVVPGPPSEEPVSTTVPETWTCECGQAYRVQGEDRHRVFWLADAAVSDPVLGQECPKCERPLPHVHEGRTPAA